VLFSRDIINNLQLVGSVRLPFNMEVGVRARYTSGYPTTPITGIKYYDATNFMYVPQYGETYSARMEPYVGLDTRFEKKFVFKSWMLTLYMEAVNIVHLLQFVQKDNGDPLYSPPETGFYIWTYDYSMKRVLSDVFRTSAGLMVEF
jgi:hypothetical protein